MKTQRANLTIRQADYASEEPALRSIRFEVFVAEQRVPPAIEMDERDPLCVHFLALLDDTPVGTARIDIEKSGKVGRLAVRADWRGRGVGRALMERCHEVALEHGLAEVWCHAQVTAVPFYERLGYRVTGEPFEEAGIEHRHMTMTLGA